MARLPPALRGRPLDWGDDEAATRVQGDAASLSLLAREGPISGHIFGSDGHPITIGRGSSCAVRLALSEISRRHATIRYHAGRYWVEDLQTLNGTKVNDHLIDGPTPLKQGDRIRVGAQLFEVRFDALANREVVYDGPNSEAVSVSVSTPQRAIAGAVRPLLSPAGIGVLAVLAISSGVLLAFAIPRQARHALAAPTRAQTASGAASGSEATRAAGAALPSPSGSAPAASAAMPASPPIAPIRAHIEVDGDVALTAREVGSVQWAAARGMPVRAGDPLLRFRHDDAAKQRELDHINEQLEDDDSNPKLIRRAHALADELEAERGSSTLKSEFDGIVIASPAAGARVQSGVAEVRVARRVRLVVDVSAISGAGSACDVVFLDQQREAEGRRVVGGVGATIELTRFAEKLSFAEVGRVRADCKE